MNDNDNPLIGYSALALYDECYEYNENACYIADSQESLLKFLEDAVFNVNDYRIDTTSNLPVILLNTCGGSIEFIQSMILNKQANDYCRVSACQALAYAVIEGYVSREKAVAFFKTLFTGQEADEISDFWGLIASYVCDLYPQESMDVIKKAYDDGLIMPGLISYSEFEHALAIGKDKCLEKLTIDLNLSSLDDIHDRMSWWACFNEEAETAAFSDFMDDGLFPDYSEQGTTKSQKSNKKNKKRNGNRPKRQRKKTEVN